MTIPVFIVMHNQFSMMKSLVTWLERAGAAEELYIVDNASTYEPLLEWYEKTPHNVIMVGQNAGHTVCFTHGIFRQHVKDRKFLLTDPDIEPVDDCPHDAVDHMADLLDRYPDMRKAGFSLKLDDLPDYYHLKGYVLRHEGQFWGTYDMEAGAYRSPIDTTFAVYQSWATQIHDISNAFRTRPPYVARHLSWYLDRDFETDEERFMRENVDPNKTHWSGH